MAEIKLNQNYIHEEPNAQNIDRLLAGNKHYEEELLKAEQYCLTKLQECRKNLEIVMEDGKQLLRTKKMLNNKIITN
jgi:hypothetical protein